MEIGDLVEVTFELPNWHWLSFKTGDIGVVLEIRDYGALYDYRIVKVLLTKEQRIESIPEPYLSLLGAE